MPRLCEHRICVIYNAFILCGSGRNTNLKAHGRAERRAIDSLSEYGEACIELHTHPDGVIHFSSADDRDESGKFRIFGILIDIHSPSPKIRFRCGVYDYFAQIPADYISEMPEGVLDLNRYEQLIKKAGL